MLVRGYFTTLGIVNSLRFRSLVRPPHAPRRPAGTAAGRLLYTNYRIPYTAHGPKAYTQYGEVRLQTQTHQDEQPNSRDKPKQESQETTLKYRSVCMLKVSVRMSVRRLGFTMQQNSCGRPDTRTVTAHEALTAQRQ